MGGGRDGGGGGEAGVCGLVCVVGLGRTGPRWFELGWIAGFGLRMGRAGLGPAEAFLLITMQK